MSERLKYGPHLFVLSFLLNFVLFSQFPTAKPVLFKTQLQNVERQAGESVSFRCDTTKPGPIVVWRCGNRVLTTSSKYQLKCEGTVVELIIYKLQGADSGEYSCDTGYQKTSAILTVKGMISLLKIFLIRHPSESHFHVSRHTFLLITFSRGNT